MIGQMTGQIKPRTGQEPWGSSDDRSRRREEILHTIDGLYVVSRRGLWRLLLFLVVSAAAVCVRNVDLFASLPENIREVLGAPPPADLIHIILVVSTVSALILIAGRTTGDAKAGPGWVQIGLSVSFYLLYASANLLNEAFPAVFLTGVTILLLEYFTTSCQASRSIREKKERLAGLR